MYAAHPPTHFGGPNCGEHLPACVSLSTLNCELLGDEWFAQNQSKGVGRYLTNAACRPSWENRHRPSFSFGVADWLVEVCGRVANLRSQTNDCAVYPLLPELQSLPLCWAQATHSSVFAIRTHDPATSSIKPIIFYGQPSSSEFMINYCAAWCLLACKLHENPIHLSTDIKLQSFIFPLLSPLKTHSVCAAITSLEPAVKGCEQ